MKTKFTLKGLEIGEIKIGDVAVETEFSVKEAWGMKNLAKSTAEDILHNMPKYLEQIATAQKKFEELDAQIQDERAQATLPITLRIIKASYNVEMAECAVKKAYEEYPEKYHDEIHKAFIEVYHDITCGLSKFRELSRKVVFAETVKELNSIHKEAIKCLDSEYLPDLETSIKERRERIEYLSDVRKVVHNSTIPYGCQNDW